MIADTMMIAFSLLVSVKRKKNKDFVLCYEVFSLLLFVYLLVFNSEQKQSIMSI